MTESRTDAGRGGNRILLLNGHRVSVWNNEVLDIDSCSGYTTLLMCLIMLNCTLNGKFYVMYILP